jgi:hypothetical protein
MLEFRKKEMRKDKKMGVKFCEIQCVLWLYLFSILPLFLRDHGLNVDNPLLFCR